MCRKADTSSSSSRELGAVKHLAESRGRRGPPRRLEYREVDSRPPARARLQSGATQREDEPARAVRFDRRERDAAIHRGHFNDKCRELLEARYGSAEEALDRDAA